MDAPEKTGEEIKRHARAVQLVQATKAVMDAAEEVVDSHEAHRPMKWRLKELADAVAALRHARERVFD